MALGRLPLAYGIGSGGDMLRPWSISVIGVVDILVILSLVVTPTACFLLRHFRESHAFAGLGPRE